MIKAPTSNFEITDGPPLTYSPRIVFLVEKATQKIECVWQIEGSSTVPVSLQKHLAHSGFELRECTAKNGLDQEELETELREFLRAHGNPTPPLFKPRTFTNTVRAHNHHASDCICKTCLRQLRLDAEQATQIQSKVPTSKGARK
jgi:hypothetical protein